MLTIRISGKSFPTRQGGRRLVLDPLHLAVPEGQLACLVGPSGCGKTTLLHMIAGLEPAEDNSPALNGLAGGDGAPDGRGGIGYVFQSPRLMPWLSVLDNVTLVTGASNAGRERARALLCEMGLESHLHEYASRLSGGMQRRVALARAFVTRPRLLLLDEPFASLDRPLAGNLRLLLLRLWREHPATVLFVTHDLNEALLLGDRVLFLGGTPARVILDWPVTLPRPRADDAALRTCEHELLQHHPDLLKGRASPAAAP